MLGENYFPTSLQSRLAIEIDAPRVETRLDNIFIFLSRTSADEFACLFFRRLIIMVISDCHESGTRLAVTRFAVSRADGKKQHRCFNVTKIIGKVRFCECKRNRDITRKRFCVARYIFFASRSLLRNVVDFLSIQNPLNSTPCDIDITQTIQAG